MDEKSGELAGQKLTRMRGEQTCGYKRNCKPRYVPEMREDAVLPLLRGRSCTVNWLLLRLVAFCDRVPAKTDEAFRHVAMQCLAQDRTAGNHFKEIHSRVPLLANYPATRATNKMNTGAAEDHRRHVACANRVQ
jgi:hypothetical protein